MSDSELRLHVVTHITRRHFAVWHDHSTVCGYGFILVTCQEVYDRLVHYTDTEYKALTGQSVDVQALVERPYLHLLVVGSSSALDHMAFTADRLECVKALDTTVQAPGGTEVTDILWFFNGDKMAQWTEGGCQAGGNYKCGSCGVCSKSIIDAAHCNQLPYRSLTDTQVHVLAGGHGGKMNCLRPFDSLTHQEVRRELATRKLDSEGNSREFKIAVFFLTRK